MATTSSICYKAMARPRGMSSFTSAARSSGPFAIEDFKFQFYQQPQGWPGAKVTTDMPDHGQHPPGSL